MIIRANSFGHITKRPPSSLINEQFTNSFFLAKTTNNNIE